VDLQLILYCVAISVVYCQHYWSMAVQSQSLLSLCGSARVTFTASIIDPWQFRACHCVEVCALHSLPALLIHGSSEPATVWKCVRYIHCQHYWSMAVQSLPLCGSVRATFTASIIDPWQFSACHCVEVCALHSLPALLIHGSSEPITVVTVWKCARATVFFLPWQK
jgi:hypothetical protein